ncbi:multiple epidermal growth factor-like domains protein 8, partial [Rhinoraja longicauda]
MKGSGISASGLAYCLWVLSVSNSLEPCPDQHPCPSISLTVASDISLECGKDYVYAFDGLPRFLTEAQPASAIYADPRLIGAFCGWGQEHPITVEAHS